ncbi:MAG: ABC transporter ATP-binding protein [Casimicrobiaceae bacterium]
MKPGTLPAARAPQPGAGLPGPGGIGTDALVPGFPLLEVEGLCVHFPTASGPAKALDGIALLVRRRESVGVLGEFGAGKTTLVDALMDLVQGPGRIVAGRIAFAGRDMGAMSAAERVNERGRRIAVIASDSRRALDPACAIETQLDEALQVHVPTPRLAAREHIRAALLRAGIAFPDEVLHAFPMSLPLPVAQRIGVALAFLHGPELVMADDPARALEPAARAALLYDIGTAAREVGATMLWLSEDPDLLKGVAARLMVLYAGRIVEEGPTDAILRDPAHPYTRGIVDALPVTGLRAGRLKPTAGKPPTAHAMPSGCAFRERCGHAMRACVAAPALSVVGDEAGGGGGGRAVRCHHPLVRPRFTT